MKFNLLKNTGKALKFVTKRTETPLLSSYLKNQSSPFLKATGKTLELVTKDSSISSYLKNHSSPVLKVTGKTLSLIVNNGTPDYLKQSSNNYGKSGKVAMAGAQGAEEASSAMDEISNTGKESGKEVSESIT
jgi:hypothetical protein